MMVCVRHILSAPSLCVLSSQFLLSQPLYDGPNMFDESKKKI